MKIWQFDFCSMSVFIIFIVVNIVKLAICENDNFLDNGNGIYKSDSLTKQLINSLQEGLRENTQNAPHLTKRDTFRPWGGKRSFSNEENLISDLYDPFSIGEVEDTNQISDESNKESFEVEYPINRFIEDSKENNHNKPKEIIYFESDSLPQERLVSFDSTGISPISDIPFYQTSKRAKFNPWAGKRAKFNPWAGKKRNFSPWVNDFDARENWNNPKINNPTSYDFDAREKWNNPKVSDPTSYNSSRTQNSTLMEMNMPKEENMPQTKTKHQFNNYKGYLKKDYPVLNEMLSSLLKSYKQQANNLNNGKFYAWAGKK